MTEGDCVGVVRNPQGLRAKLPKRVWHGIVCNAGGFMQILLKRDLPEGRLQLPRGCVQTPLKRGLPRGCMLSPLKRGLHRGYEQTPMIRV